MNKSTRPFLAVTLSVIASLALLSSCKKDPVDINPASGAVANTAYVNNWILENMRDWYYWNDKIPANPNLSLGSAAFFESLLNRFNPTTNPQGDRFSVIRESSDEIRAGLSGESKTTGLNFQLLRVAEGSSSVVGVVTYVLPGSPADKEGMKRGDIFFSVNGTVLTTDQSVLNQAFADPNVTQTYGLGTFQNGVFTRISTTKSVTPVVFQENPIFKDSIYTVGTRKVGYLLYNQFFPSPNGSSVPVFDNQIVGIFGKFKAQGVNELILDLRYNGGGYTSSAQLLASQIVKGVAGQTNALFYRTEYNPSLTIEIKKLKNADEILNTFFIPAPNNIGNQLDRVYVLTTDDTASASELIINGLRPYMPVHTIGTRSFGKNVGSRLFSDEKNKNNRWGFLPIVSRSFNKNNESDYWTGFAPTVEVREPYSQLFPIGDLRDPMLATAINHMNGRTGGRRAVGPDLTVGSSDDFKPGAKSMFSENPLRR